MDKRCEKIHAAVFAALSCANRRWINSVIFSNNLRMITSQVKCDLRVVFPISEWESTLRYATLDEVRKIPINK